MARASPADISKAIELVGYEPTRDSHEGVDEFIALYRDNRDWYEPLVLNS